MALIQITPQAAAAAAGAVGNLTQRLDEDGAFPTLSYENAPIATVASDDASRRWSKRLSMEVQAADGLAQAFTVVAQVFAESDGNLATTVADLQLVAGIDEGTS